MRSWTVLVRPDLVLLPPKRRRWSRLALATFLIAVVAEVVTLSLPARSFPRATVAQALWMTMCAAAAVAAWRRARREPDARLGWQTLAAAMLFLVAVGAMVLVENLAAHVALPSPRLGDWLALAGFVAIGFAILGWPLGPPDMTERVRTFLDAVVFANASFSLLWALLLGRLDRAAVGAATWAFVVTQFGTITVLFGVVVYVGARDVRRFRGPLGWFSAALALGFAGTLGILWLSARGSYFAGHPVDLVPIIAVACFVAGAGSPRPITGTAPRGGPAPARRGIGLPYIPLVVAIPVAFWVLVVEGRQETVLTACGFVTFVALALRQFLALRDVQTLSQQLEARVADRSRALEQSQAALVRAQRLEALGRLGGGIAHDFNNLLMAILAQAELLAMALPDGHSGVARTDQIRRTVERGAGLSKQLLAFARQQPRRVEAFDAGELLADTEPLLKPLLGEKVELIVRGTLRGGHVRMDPGQLEQVLLNLAVNARDAMPDGGGLTIESATLELDAVHRARFPAAAADPHVRIRVQDTGHGMTADVLARVFEPFFTTKPDAQGSGLGLAVCYGIIEQAGGQITVESAPGSGATFEIFLPCAEPPEKARERGDTQTAAGSETVLVAEDEDAVREPLVAALRARGFMVLAAADGEEAVAVAAAHRGPLHLMLSDMVMPRMLGLEAAGRVAAQRPETRFLIVSGYAPDTHGDSGLEGRRMEFVAKPVSPLELARRVRGMLDS